MRNDILDNLSEPNLLIEIPSQHWANTVRDVHLKDQFLYYLYEELSNGHELKVLIDAIEQSKYPVANNYIFWKVLYDHPDEFTLYFSGVRAAMNFFDSEYLVDELLNQTIDKGEEYLPEMGDNYFEKVHFENQDYFIYSKDPFIWKYDQ